ncbi:MAG: winged helix-turn-helix transcriptional regulator [Burkholderiales bacterium]|nr:winged helix-turn-helix transcriptional regulator [Burkholderiales bacterium]
MAVRQGAVVITFVLPAPVKTPEKSQTQEKMQEKTREKTSAAILRMFGEQPEMSIAELAERLGKVPSTIERAIRKLRESGRLQRIGPDKGGRWELIE